MLEDEHAQQARRHATGASWPRREEVQGEMQGEIPYLSPRLGRDNRGGPPPVPPEESRSDFQEIQRTMGQIAESGRRTFSSIVSRVKAKINEYEQTRCVFAPNDRTFPPTSPGWKDALYVCLSRCDGLTSSQEYWGAARPWRTGDVTMGRRRSTCSS